MVSDKGMAGSELCFGKLNDIKSRGRRESNFLVACFASSSEKQLNNKLGWRWKRWKGGGGE